MKTRLLTLTALAATATLLACTPPTSRSTPPVEPVACVDPTFVQLKKENPDSLSDRRWEQLQSLERACTAERTRGEASMGMGHARGHWTGGHWMAAVGGVMMLAMVVAMF